MIIWGFFLGGGRDTPFFSVQSGLWMLGVCGAQFENSPELVPLENENGIR